MRRYLYSKTILSRTGKALILVLWIAPVGCRSQSHQEPEAPVYDQIDKQSPAVQAKATARTGQARRREEKEMMDQFAKLPYGQPFADLQLSSVASAKLGQVKPKSEKVTSLAIPQSNAFNDEAQWLLTGAESTKMIAAGQFHYWLLDLQKGESIAFSPISENTVVTFLPDGRYIYNPSYGLSLRKTEPLSDWRSANGIIDANVQDMSPSSVPYALIPMADEYVILIQNFAHPGDSSFKEAVLSRKPYVGKMRSLKWSVEYQEYSARSPFLSDGTLVVFFSDVLRLIDLDGKEVGQIKAELLPGMVSADGKDTIWGLKEAGTGLKLQAFRKDGAQVAEVAIPAANPTQPLVTLEDGRILVVTKTKLVCVKDTKILWEKALAKGLAKPADLRPDTRPNIGLHGGQDPLVTASSNGKILVKHGPSLMLLEDGPEPEWEIKAPDDKWITSNAVITSDGRVCFACKQEIYCLSK